MTHARKPRPPRKRPPEWLQDALGVAAQLLAVSLTAAVLHGVGVTPVIQECPGGDSRRPVAAEVRGPWPADEPNVAGSP
jgi:hypothetical protein